MTTIGPDKQLSQFVDTFLKELEDDFQAPALSKFQDYMPKCRKGVQMMEESLSMDKNHVHKLIGSLKELHKTGEVHGNTMSTCADDMVKFGTAMSTTEPTLGNNFVKFGTLLNQMSSLLTNLATSTRNILLFSLNLLFENELKGSRYKSDMKALMGQYQSARNQVEKEEKKTLIQAGVNIQDRVFTAEEMAGKLINERRRFQMGACEYMLKFNDVKTKRGVDLAEHLVGYYQAQESYFKDGNTLLQALKTWETRFGTQITELRAKQDEERKRLQVARDSLREEMGIGQKAHCPTHIDPQAGGGITEKTGYLGKRPENALRIARRQWPKRYCSVSMQGFTLAHSHTHAPHVKIPVMHFQFKDVPEAIDGRKNCFKLIAQTKTYTFDAESEKELSEWRITMNNCQLKLFQGETDTMQRTMSIPRAPTISRNVRELVKSIIGMIRGLPGNDKCCDCNTADPEWLSVNLGILICINCSGRHRELSVQYSRIRSLRLDQIKTTELLIALVMGNGLLNEVLEANLTEPKPTPDAPTDKRQEFISKKYLQRKFIEHSVGKDALLTELHEAVDCRDIKQLLQVYAEGVDLCAPLPSFAGGMTALHLAIELEDLTSLHIVDFLLGNSNRTENCIDSEGNTPLHTAVENDQPQCVKLILNHGANIDTKNNAGKSPVDIAEEKNYNECLELLQDAAKKKFTKCEHIDVDWGVGDQEEDIYQTPLVDMQPPEGGMKKSETTGNIADNFSPATFRASTKSISIAALVEGGRRRPTSSLIDRKQLQPPDPPLHQHSADNLTSASGPALPKRPGHRRHNSSDNILNQMQQTPQLPQPTTPQLPPRAPFQPKEANVYPPPSEPAPPPPPRTVSRTADALLSSGSQLAGPVRPKRKKRNSMYPDQLEPMSLSYPAQPHPELMLVEALYDCNPDHKDELGFSEGERIMVTKKLNRDWWRGYIESNPSREGVFPVNYVLEITALNPE